MGSTVLGLFPPQGIDQGRGAPQDILVGFQASPVVIFGEKGKSRGVTAETAWLAAPCHGTRPDMQGERVHCPSKGPARARSIPWGSQEPRTAGGGCRAPAGPSTAPLRRGGERGSRGGHQGTWKGSSSTDAAPDPAPTHPWLPCSPGRSASCWHPHQAGATSSFYRNQIKP